MDKVKKFIIVISEGDSLKDKTKLLLTIPIQILFRGRVSKVGITIRNSDGRFKCPDLDAAFMYSEIREDKVRKFFRLKNGDTFIDVGSNIGKYAIMLANRNPRSNIIAIEPDARAISVFKKNIEFNSLKNITIVEKVAIDKASRLPLYLNVANSARNTLFKNEIAGQSKYVGERVSFNMKKVFVDSIPLDSLPLKGARVGLIKIDVQGAEFEVIRGAKKIINKHKPQIIFETYTKSRLKEIEQFLSKYNYKVMQITEFDYIATYKRKG